ncbi:MAG: D-alanine--D-alanine ligase [Fusobacteria bacterium]|nr:D-alanine--D-alanine ligase [Fusobacteriota bacterium]
MNKKHIALFFGGKSSEHAISILSTRNIFQALSKDKYTIYLVKIEKNGDFSLVSRDDLLSDRIYKGNFEKISFGTIESKACFEHPVTGAKIFIDVAIPILHGAFGEDGKIQGYFETLNIKYVGCDTVASALAMNKELAKQLVAIQGIDIAKFELLKRGESVDVAKVVAKLGLPIFVKPSCEGSSYGVSKVKNIEDLIPAIEEAFKFDKTVLLEECIVGREVECGILGNREIEASEVGEVVTADFYSYESKYENDSAKIEIPANLISEQRERVRSVAKKVYQILGCSGLSRVDFFLTPTRLVFNEVNTFPGFTNISMYPKLFEAVGIGYSELLDKLIQLAVER